MLCYLSKLVQMDMTISLVDTTSDKFSKKTTHFWGFLNWSGTKCGWNNNGVKFIGFNLKMSQKPQMDC